MIFIKLSKKYVLNNENIYKLKMDLENLSSLDLITAEKELILLEENTSVLAELNKTYLSIIAAKASGTTVDFIKNLNIKDFTTITICIQNFLLGSMCNN